MNDVTRFLNQVSSDDPSVSEELLPLIYDELRKLASSRLAQERPGQTLQATALVHEAYLRLVKDDQTLNWDSRGHFFTAAAEAMRRILIERARKRKRSKHGGDLKRHDLEILCPASSETPDHLLAIDEALENLQRDHPDIAKLLKLRYFTGMSIKNAAPLLGISLATAKRRWTFARAFLYEQIGDD